VMTVETVVTLAVVIVVRGELSADESTYPT
jgi:hypothetical protein